MTIERLFKDIVVTDAHMEYVLVLRIGRVDCSPGPLSIRVGAEITIETADSVRQFRQYH